MDPTHNRVYGRAKQGAQIGRLKGVRTLHPIFATRSTPISRPVIASVRMAPGQGRRRTRHRAGISGDGKR